MVSFDAETDLKPIKDVETDLKPIKDVKTDLKPIILFIIILQRQLERVDWDGLVTWRERIRKTGYQLAEIWLLQEILEKAGRKRGGISRE